jgi:hypothetical protein
MGRYEDLMKMMKPEVSAQDEAQKADNPRNWLADKVNPALDEYINPMLPDSFKLNVPEMTVADEKRYQADLPETMAGAAMGSISANPARFGKIIQQAEKPQNLGKVIMAPEAAQSVGSVKLMPSAADKAADAVKSGMTNKPLKANEVSEKLQSLFGEELMKRKADMKKGLISPDAYNSFKQEMTDKVRRGEQ